jgi:hypothetical protein
MCNPAGKTSVVASISLPVRSSSTDSSSSSAGLDYKFIAVIVGPAVAGLIAIIVAGIYCSRRRDRNRVSLAKSSKTTSAVYTNPTYEGRRSSSASRPSNYDAFMAPDGVYSGAAAAYEVPTFINTGHGSVLRNSGYEESSSDRTYEAIDGEPMYAPSGPLYDVATTTLRDATFGEEQI